jgi:hypothetical protein
MIIKFDTSSVGGQRNEDMRDEKKTHDVSSGGRSKEAICSNLNKDAVSWLQKMAVGMSQLQACSHMDNQLTELWPPKDM